MRRRLLLATALLLALPAARSLADDGWIQVTSAGFGSGSSVPEGDRGALFHDPSDGRDYAYFGIKNPTAGGSAFRSVDGINWARVTSNGFGLGASLPAVIWVSTFNNTVATYAYAGTAAPAVGARIYRSAGTPLTTSWGVVFSSLTTGNTNTTALAGYPAAFQNAFYVGTENPTSGGEIWKSTSADNEGNWIQVSSGGFGSATKNRNISYLKKFGANLYAATNCTPANVPCGQIWRSTGTLAAGQYDTWTEVVSASTTFDASLMTASISAMEEFNGNFYVTTLKANGGAQMWRTANPVAGPWFQVYTGDGTCPAQASGACTDTTGAARFSVAASTEIHSLYNLDGILYAGTWDPSGSASGGAIVYRSTDGVTWTRANASAGFGAATTEYVGGFVRLGSSVCATTLDSTLGGSVWSAPLPTPSTPTVAGGGIQTSSITITYGLVGNAGNGFRVDASTMANFTGTILSSVTLNPALASLAPQGLSPNTTYYFRAGALWGSATSFSTVVPATSTLLTAIASGFPGPLNVSSITVNWSTNGNGPGTRYTVQASSDGFVTALTSVTYNAFATFTGLPSNTLFASSVSARGNDATTTAFISLPSTSTLLLPPTPGGTPFTTVDVASATVAWTDPGNPGGPLFAAQISTSAAFTTINFTSITANTSVLFGTGGAGAALSPNTSYYFQVKSSAAANVSAFLAIGTTITLAASPSATTVLSASSTTAQIDWQPNGNPEPGTRYQVWQATDSLFSAPLQTLVSTSLYTTSGLSPKTTYYFQVRALNGNGVLSAFDVTQSTLTNPVQPSAPGTPSGFAQGVSSISWIWALATDATSYNVFVGSNTASLVASTGSVSFTETGLLPNTTASIAVAGLDIAGAGPLSSASSAVFTLANVPTSISSPTVLATSVTVAWGISGNSPGTTASVERSTDNAAFAAVFSGGTTYYSDASLLGCSTYYYRVRNQNGGGIFSGYSGSLQFYTAGSTPTAPTSLAAASLTGNKIVLSWVPSSFEGIARYRLFYDSGQGIANIAYGSPIAVFTSTETSYTTGVLASSGAYTFALRATGRCGIEEQTGVVASAASIAALSSVRTAVTSPSSGRRVSGTRVTVSADLISGTAAQTAQVLFQYKASTSATWANLPSAVAAEANPSLTAPYFIHWDVSGLTATNYDLRAVDTDINASSDTAPASVTVAVDPVNPDITEGVVSGKLQTAQIINTAVSNTITTADSGSSLLTSLTLPAGSLTSSTVTVTVVSNPTSPAAVPLDDNGTGMMTSITLSDGETAFQAGKLATLTLSYADADKNDVIDGTAVGVDQMKFFSYNAASAKWVNDIATTVNKASHTVTGRSPHFSFFAVFGVPAQDLKGVRVYPNPWKPNGANADEGKPFNASDITTGIIFDRLPASVTIKIYTVSGQPVAKFTPTLGTGTLRWDGRNDSGRDVASGLYVAVITSANLPSVTRKILVIR